MTTIGGQPLILPDARPRPEAFGEPISHEVGHHLGVHVGKSRDLASVGRGYPHTLLCPQPAMSSREKPHTCVIRRCQATSAALERRNRSPSATGQRPRVGPNLLRLRVIKNAVDPMNLFRFNPLAGR